MALLFKKIAVSASLMAGLTTSVNVRAATLEALEAKLQAQAVEMQNLKAELDAIKASRASLSSTTTSSTPPDTDTTSNNGAAASSVASGNAAPAQRANGNALGLETVLSSYGEISYSRPKGNSQDAQIDVGRAVIGISHRFDERTKMVAEFEWEHAVTSADDQGESEVEQLYVERTLSNDLRVKGGLFLIPAGLLNNNHEPTAYYGVHRNAVETAIIPTTWREVGVAIGGTTASSLSWETGITTGFDLTKWDPNATEGRESPLGSIHQEGQLAKAKQLSVYGAVNWQGIPGLLLGGSVFSGKAGHSTVDFNANDARVSLFDVHGRYQTGRWDLSALYAKGYISNSDLLNLSFIGSPTPVPSSFDGGFAQVAYKLWTTPEYVLSPFARYERLNTAKAYGNLPLAGGAVVGPDQQIVTLGANLMVGEGVVLKADYQKFKDAATSNRLNLGMGYSF